MPKMPVEEIMEKEAALVAEVERLLPGFVNSCHDKAKYVRGFLSGGSYEAIPLEMNAYELDARFARAPTRAFSVSDEVQTWINGGRL